MTGATTARCARDDCSVAVGRNGVACHRHFTEKVPDFLRAAFFSTKHEFTKRWLTQQVRHVVRDEPFSA